MEQAFEIFKIEEDGSCVGFERAPSFQIAELTVRTLAVACPGKYLIFDHHTGEATLMNLEVSLNLPA